MKKKLLSLLLGLLMLVCVSCRPAGEDPGPPYDPGAIGEADRMAYVPETDYDNMLGDNQFCLVETEDAYYWAIRTSNYIRFYDKASGGSGVLCAKPQCEHDAVNPNQDCSGYLSDVICNFSYYDGKLYFVSYDYSQRGCCLFSIDPDGTNRKLIKKLEYTEGDHFEQCCVHRGKLYVVYSTIQVIAGAPNCRFSVKCTGTDPKSGTTVIMDETLQCSVWSKVRFIGSYLYIMKSTEDKNEVCETTVYRWDIDKEELEVLGTDKTAEKGFTQFWVDREGICYMSADFADRGDRLVRLKDGAFEETVLLCGEEEKGHIVALCDGVIVSLFRDEGYTRIEELRLTDYDGNVLFSGVPELPFFDEYKELGDFMFYPSSIFGSGSTVYIGLHPIVRNDPSLDGQSRELHTHLVRFEITPDGLVETLLGIESWR